jgi:UDP-N-acetylmuramate dehydrogenase
MEVLENVSLKSLNTFGLAAKARYFAVVEKESDLLDISNSPHTPLVLGGGSNILFSKDYEGLVLKNNLLGKEIIKQDPDYVWLRIGGGENWHDLVLWAIEQGWAGIENLSLIPGTVGAAPMQNIGAYGVELSSVFHSLEAFELATGKTKIFNQSDCRFGYRYSIFKGPFKGKYFISRVVLKLRKEPVFNTSYGAIAQTLKEMDVERITIKSISDAVTKIRESKLPDPRKIGNAGSFFKNPTVEENIFNNLKTEYANMPGYPAETGYVKIPAGWLIEQCRWKGFRQGDAGVHAKQALVLVNYGKAQGTELVALSGKIKSSVMRKFGIELTPEVNII